MSGKIENRNAALGATVVRVPEYTGDFYKITGGGPLWDDRKELNDDDIMFFNAGTTSVNPWWGLEGSDVNQSFRELIQISLGGSIGHGHDPVQQDLIRYRNNKFGNTSEGIKKAEGHITGIDLSEYGRLAGLPPLTIRNIGYTAGPNLSESGKTLIAMNDFGRKFRASLLEMNKHRSDKGLQPITKIVIPPFSSGAYAGRKSVDDIAKAFWIGFLAEEEWMKQNNPTGYSDSNLKEIYCCNDTWGTSFSQVTPQEILNEMSRIPNIRAELGGLIGFGGGMLKETLDDLARQSNPPSVTPVSTGAARSMSSAAVSPSSLSVSSSSSIASVSADALRLGSPEAVLPPPISIDANGFFKKFRNAFVGSEREAAEYIISAHSKDPEDLIAINRDLQGGSGGLYIALYDADENFNSERIRNSKGEKVNEEFVKKQIKYFALILNEYDKTHGDDAVKRLLINTIYKREFQDQLLEIAQKCLKDLAASAPTPAPLQGSRSAGSSRAPALSLSAASASSVVIASVRVPALSSDSLAVSVPGPIVSASNPASIPVPKVSSTTRSKKSGKKKSDQISARYAYTDHEINAVVKAYDAQKGYKYAKYNGVEKEIDSSLILQTDTKLEDLTIDDLPLGVDGKAHAVFRIPAIAYGQESSIENSFKDDANFPLMRQIMTVMRKAPGAPIDILIPYKLKAWHWNAARIQVTIGDDGKVMVDAKSFDPNGTSVFTREMQQEIKNVFDKLGSYKGDVGAGVEKVGVKYSFEKTEEIAVQTGVACGAYAARMLNGLVDGKRTGKDFHQGVFKASGDRKTETEIRQEDFLNVKRYAPLDRDKFGRISEAGFINRSEVIQAIIKPERKVVLSNIVKEVARFGLEKMWFAYEELDNARKASDASGVFYAIRETIGKDRELCDLFIKKNENQDFIVVFEEIGELIELFGKELLAEFEKRDNITDSDPSIVAPRAPLSSAPPSSASLVVSVAPNAVSLPASTSRAASVSAPRPSFSSTPVSRIVAAAPVSPTPPRIAVEPVKIRYDRDVVKLQVLEKSETPAVVKEIAELKSEMDIKFLVVGTSEPGVNAKQGESFVSFEVRTVRSRDKDIVTANGKQTLNQNTEVVTVKMNIEVGDYCALSRDEKGKDVVVLDYDRARQDVMDWYKRRVRKIPPTAVKVLMAEQVANNEPVRVR